MKVSLTYKEANILAAILWEIGEENAIVIGGTYAAGPFWRLSDDGRDLVRSVMDKLEYANNDANQKSGKDRDLSGSPKGTIQDAKWSA